MGQSWDLVECCSLSGDENAESRCAPYPAHIPPPFHRPLHLAKREQIALLQDIRPPHHFALLGPAAVVPTEGDACFWLVLDLPRAPIIKLSWSSIRATSTGNTHQVASLRRTPRPNKPWRSFVAADLLTREVLEHRYCVY